MMDTSIGTPWTQLERDQWFAEQTVKRSYASDIVPKIEALATKWNAQTYGRITVDEREFPLFSLRSTGESAGKKTVLITGEVHGYETSGILGALEFMRGSAESYAHDFHFICAPCISPWAYETVNRWNAQAIDPNRSFVVGSPAPECELFRQAIAEELPEIFAHFDLHETTDTDNTVFRPALQSRDGKVQELTEIPDGFYVVGDTANPTPEFQAAIIDAVRKITHIAPADADGRIIGEPVEQPGVIHYPLKKLSLCAGISAAKFTTTTEVYPDSPRATPEICVAAQVAAICGGLDYLRAKRATPAAG